MQLVMAGLNWQICITFQDDILIFSKAFFSEHVAARAIGQKRKKQTAQKTKKKRHRERTKKPVHPSLQLASAEA